MKSLTECLRRWEWVPILLMRLFVGYFFLETGWGKVTSLGAMAERFAQWGIPLPAFSAALSGYTELVGGALVLVGLLTRLVSVPLFINMLVAILSVKLRKVAGLDDFVELDEPLYALVFLWLVFSGPGKASLDALLGPWVKRRWLLRVLPLCALMSLAGCDGVERAHRPMPELGLRDLTNAPITLASLRGKPWVINIWLPACSACADEVPALEKVRHELEPQGVGFMALSLSSDTAATATWAERMGIHGRIATASGAIMDALGVDEAPSTLFVSRDGLILARRSGTLGEAALHRWTLALLHGKL